MFNKSFRLAQMAFKYFFTFLSNMWKHLGPKFAEALPMIYWSFCLESLARKSHHDNAKSSSCSSLFKDLKSSSRSRLKAWHFNKKWITSSASPELHILHLPSPWYERHFIFRASRSIVLLLHANLTLTDAKSGSKFAGQELLLRIWVLVRWKAAGSSAVMVT